MAKEAAAKKEPVRAGRSKPTTAPADGQRGFQPVTVEVKNVIRPVQNAIAILRYLTDTGEPKTVTQIARALQLNTSTCFNILRTLAGEQIIAFDATRKTYQIGVGIMKIAAGAISEENRLSAARPLIKSFAERHNAMVCIWRRLSADRNIVVATEHAGGAIRLHMEVGQKVPVLLGATGRVMLPYLGLSKAQLREEFKKLRWFRAPTFEDFLEGAREAQECGWGTDDGNFSPGVLALSTPIINTGGVVSYALTSATFRDQHTGQDTNELGKDLLALARELRSVLH